MLIIVRLPLISAHVTASVLIVCISNDSAKSSFNVTVPNL